MSQIYAQHNLRGVLAPVLPGPSCYLYLLVPRLVRWSVVSGSPPADDLLTPHLAKQTAGPGQTAGQTSFDSRQAWAVVVVAGSLAVSLCLMSNIDTLDSVLAPGSQWAKVALVLNGNIVLDAEQS